MASGWGRSWVAAVVVVVVVLGGLEGFWRARGHRPSAVDDEDLWAYERSRADGPGVVALLGASRMQMGFSTELARALRPERFVNLAVEGRAPLAVLRDLARDENFVGLVVCSITAQGFERKQRERQQRWVEHYHHRARLERMLDRHFTACMQASLVVAGPRLALPVLLRRFARGKPPPDPAYLVTHADRSHSADYRLIHIGSHRAWRIARRARGYARATIPSPEQWAIEAAEAAPWVAAIRARGGEVVFVRFPTSGEHWKLDERYYPRARYWDRVAAVTGAATIHFRDLPDAAGLLCPDTSHLDQRDAPRFTRALLAELERRGLLESTGSGGESPGPAPR